MRDFFALVEVHECMETQKRNPSGSKAHENATTRILEIAREFGVEEYFL